jgi:CRP-like cAMP-binding protein
MSSDRKKRILDQVDLMQPRQIARLYPPGSRLFCKGQAPTGVFYVHEGVIDLAPRTSGGQLNQGAAGDLLGLTELFAGKKYENTAVCRTLTRVTYVEKDDLFRD